MKLALICFSILTSLSFSFGTQGKPPAICLGKILPITLLPRGEMTVASMPLRFGGTREVPRPPLHGFPTEKGFREVIKTREQFSDLWKRYTAPAAPGKWVPPLPEIDFAKEMIVVAAMGTRPSTGYGIFIDGACEVDGQVEVYVTSIENDKCGALTVLTAPADAVRLPQTDLPVVFRETQFTCTQWLDLMSRRPSVP